MKAEGRRAKGKRRQAAEAAATSQKAAKILGIRVLDRVIVSKEGLLRDRINRLKQGKNWRAFGAELESKALVSTGQSRSTHSARRPSRYGGFCRAWLTARGFCSWRLV